MPKISLRAKAIKILREIKEIPIEANEWCEGLIQHEIKLLKKAMKKKRTRVRK